MCTASTSTKRKYKTVPNINHRTEGYNNCTKKYIRGFQQQTGRSRKTQINKLENKAMKLTQTEQQKEKIILTSDNALRDLWDNIKWNNIHITEVSEREEREKEAENLSK